MKNANDCVLVEALYRKRTRASVGASECSEKTRLGQTSNILQPFVVTRFIRCCWEKPHECGHYEQAGGFFFYNLLPHEIRGTLKLRHAVVPLLIPRRKIEKGNAMSDSWKTAAWVSLLLLWAGCGRVAPERDADRRKCSSVQSLRSADFIRARCRAASKRATPIEGIGPGQGGEKYDRIVDNPFVRVSEKPLSTFSIDVDTASYSKVRQYLTEYNQLPRPDAVRIEELLNYFRYEYESPTSDQREPFATHVAVSQCPWNDEHRLVRLALKGRDMQRDVRPSSNLVLLIDSSGSMKRPNKLPLLKRGMQLLLKQLGENDRIAIVAYAGVGRPGAR